MEIKNSTNIHFKGYDARPLKALVAREPHYAKGATFSIYPQIIKKLSDIGKQEGFDVFIQTANGIFDTYSRTNMGNSVNNLPSGMGLVWAQDFLTFTPDKKLITLERLGLKKFSEAICNFFGYSLSENPQHIPGGNMFFIKEGSKNSLIIGANDFYRTGINALKQEFGADKIYPIAQPDFHIDLGIRPLKNKTILVEDQEMTLNLINEGVQKAENYLGNRPIEDDADRKSVV